MSYTPNVWDVGDVITAAKMNALEQAVADRYAAYDFVIEHDGDGFNVLKGTFANVRDGVSAGHHMLGLYLGFYTIGATEWLQIAFFTSESWDSNTQTLSLNATSDYNGNFNSVWLAWSASGIIFND